MTDPQSPLELGYESAEVAPPGRRPKWVWVVIVIYLLLVAAVVLLPLWAKLADPNEQGLLIAATISACAITLAGLGLVFTPVRLARRRPHTRRSIWIPLIASGFLMGGLVWGASLAIIECANANGNWGIAAAIGAGVVWIAWAVVIFLMTGRSDPNWVASNLHRALFAGSVAELLVAVPCHIIVRRREECCAGILTGTGIAIGCVVMLLSLGPGVMWLYYRRWQKITGN